MGEQLRLDRCAGLLFCDGAGFDPATRRWIATCTIYGEPVEFRDAVRWL